MVEVETTYDSLVVRLTGWDRLCALKSHLEVPLAHVAAARVDPEYARQPDGIRLPGAYLPRVVTAGTYRRRGYRSFWCVHDPKKAIVVDLTDEWYSRLVLQVRDPAATVAAIERALPRR